MGIIQKEFLNDLGQQSTTSAAESTTETDAGTTIKPPEKQFSFLQEKQPYADKWISQQ